MRRTLTLLLGGVAMFVLLAALYIGVLWLRLPDIGGLGDRGDPGQSEFMRTSSCDTIEFQYRPLDDIDPRLGCALVWAEDLHFFHHDGVDWAALRNAARANWDAGRILRGASTIPMQLARNLYLTPSRVYSRKLREIFLAHRLIERYQRLRLLEVYLNVVEWAPCVYGAEAAARHYFGHGARKLDVAEATFLAAMVPRPGSPPGTVRGDRTRLQQKQRRIITNFVAGGLVSRADSREALQGVVGLWHRGWRGHASAVAAAAPRSWYRRDCGTGVLKN